VVTGGTVAARLGLRDEARLWQPVAEALPLDGVDAELIEVDITADLHVADKTVREVPLPAGALMTSLVRGDRVLVPTGDTRLAHGDLVLVAMPRRRDASAQLSAWARGEDGQEPA
jgi:potassium/hydrogen antiporter